MMRLFRRVSALFTLLLLLALPSSLAAAQDRRDHERARAALEAGQIRPLTDILAEVERRYRGRVIEADLERDDGQWLYELKILPPNGRVFTIEMDAATGQFLRGRGPIQERPASETAQPPRPAGR
ncbi:PepSY domain-containing protein [Sabulicella glaciei]|uniref:PepSY domain-containing protein n=1 Tax=Sabulicella glaciei TaxID=2984948 RepID=A0ABT3NSB1_9PROT|nr:PepSY domain-containing protein [Roseococcus sp. MDT2-1-1]MCW8085045.1 PepSY domain-containing protein [Roseococcus sp. MDT2-1-1]